MTARPLSGDRPDPTSPLDDARAAAAAESVRTAAPATWPLHANGHGSRHNGAASLYGVVSVSARSMHRTTSHDTMSRSATTTTAASPGSMFLSPRVIDQDSVDELSSSLREIIEQAGAARDSLARELEEVLSRRDETHSVSAALQERLRLSARMLQAFQSQINHVESSLSRVEQYESRLCAATKSIDKALAGADERINAALASFETRLNVLVDQAVDRSEKDIEAARARVMASGPQIESLIERADALLAIGEQAEINIAQSSWRFAEARRSIEQAMSDVERCIERSQRASQGLRDDLTESADQINAMTDQSVAIRDELAAALAPLDDVLRRVRQEREPIESAERVMREGQAAAAELREIMSTLEPWRRLLQPSSGSNGADAPLPEPVVRLMDAVRRRMGQDLAAFSGALRTAAGRLAEMSDHASPRIDHEVAAAIKGSGDAEHARDVHISVTRDQAHDAGGRNVSKHNGSIDAPH